MDMDVPEVLKTVALFNQEQPGDESRASSCGLGFMFIHVIPDVIDVTSEPENVFVALCFGT